MINKIGVVAVTVLMLWLTGTVMAQSPPNHDIRGSWVFEKAYVYGNWWEDDTRWQHINPDKLAEYMREVYLEVDDYFYVRDVCESGYVRVSEPTVKFFSDRLGPDVDLPQIKVWFKGAFGVELGETVDVVLLDWEMPPYYYWMVFPGKLILSAYGDYFASFTPTAEIFTKTQPDEFGGVCSQRVISMGEVITCTYSDKTVAEAYALILTKFSYEAKHMLDVLPSANREYHSNVDDEDVFMEYIHNKDYGNIVVLLGYPGGVTTFSLRPLETGQGVEVKTIYSAD